MIIDSRIGGLGDVWMRLLALYTLTRLTNRKHTILINPVLVPMARSLFGERIEINQEGIGDAIYTHLGLRHLLGGMMSGRRYVMTFYWVKRTFRKSTTLKDNVNDALILGLSKTGLILLPDRTKITSYAGLMELSALPPFRDIGFEEFSRQACLDLPEIQCRLRDLCSSLSPKNAAEVVVYPSGTGHQIMPPSWAQNHLPRALFVFHRHDPYAGEFERVGLKVEKFGSPEELLQSGLGARRILCTDSFPSHFWQVQTTNVLLLMTQQIHSHVVHPGFPASRVLLSRASCCPCLNRARGPGNSPCDMGHSICVTWSNADYETAFEKIVSS